MATSGKTSCTLKTSGLRWSTAAAQATRPMGSGGDMASTASMRPPPSEATPARAEKAANDAARQARLVLSDGNGWTRVIEPHGVRSRRMRRPRQPSSMA